MSKQYVKLLTTAMYDVQKMRIMIDNRIGQFTRDSGKEKKELADKLNDTISNLANQMEKSISEQLAEAVESMPIMVWLHKVKGIGPRYSGSLIGMINQLPETVSALWKLCGMHTIDICTSCDKMHISGDARFKFLTQQANRRWETKLKRLANLRELQAKKKINVSQKRELTELENTDPTEFKFKAYSESEKSLCSCDTPQIINIAPKAQYYKGLLLDFSPFLRSTCWKIAGQFVRQGDFYRQHYETVKENYKNTRGNLTDGHRENMARRATVKLFLSHLWEMWRKAEGLPSGTFYLKARLGSEFEKSHTVIEPPYSDIFDKKDIAAE